MRRLTVKQFRIEMSDIFNRATITQESVTVTRHGKPVCIVVPIDPRTGLPHKTSTDSDNPMEGTE